MPKLGTVEVSDLGYGGYGVGGAYGVHLSFRAVYKVMKTAAKKCVTIFVTAPVYGVSSVKGKGGENEEAFGYAFQQLSERKGFKREGFFIVTKCGLREGTYEVDNSPEHILSSCEKSLERLRLDRIDLYILHRHKQDADMDKIVDAFCQLMDEGKIAYVGLSEISEETIRAFYEALAKRGRADRFVAIESEYSLGNPRAVQALLPVCKELGLAVLAYSPLVRGLLVDSALEPTSIFRKPLPTTDQRSTLPQFKVENLQLNLEFVREKLKPIAKMLGCTVAQLCLAWLRDEQSHQGVPIIPLISTGNRDHLKEDIDMQKVRLTPEARAAINELLAREPKPLQGDRNSAFLQQLAPEVCLHDGEGAGPADRVVLS